MNSKSLLCGPAEGFVSQVQTQPCASPPQCQGSSFVVLVFHIYIYFFYHSKTSLLDVNCQRVKFEQGNLRGETRNGSLPEGKVGRVRVSKCNVFRSNKCIR